jgi:hydroxymethylpyrimidine/phosphomethylpyrimidine kinase
MVSKSGHRLLSAEAVETIVGELFPLAELITPNLEEVAELLGRQPENESEMEDAARELAAKGPRAVLVKGGHLGSAQDAVDVLWDGRSVSRLRSPRLQVKHTHGTGCTLSAAIAANIALGLPLAKAVARAKDYLNHAMQNAYEVGKGIGPVNHMWHLESTIKDKLVSMNMEEKTDG